MAFAIVKLHQKHQRLGGKIQSSCIFVSCLTEIDEPVLRHEIIITTVSLL